MFLLYSGDITDVALSKLPSQRIDVSEFDGIIMSHLADRTEIKVSEKIRKFEIHEEFREYWDSPWKRGAKGIKFFNNKVGEPELDKIDENEEDDVENENN